MQKMLIMTEIPLISMKWLNMNIEQKEWFLLVLFLSCSHIYNDKDIRLTNSKMQKKNLLFFFVVFLLSVN